MSNVLVTGGAGFIGSHMCLALLESCHDVIVIDNLSNSCLEPLKRVEKLAQKSLIFIECDIRNDQKLRQIFKDHSIDAVIHFAGLKAVGESQRFPLSYFEHNIAGSISLFKAMEQANVFNIVFSSSATVYGENNRSPYHENMPANTPYNNYAFTKLMTEQMLEKLALADQRWSIALLRYFNPIGAHQSGQIGEDPRGKPYNLIPHLTQVAIGKREKLSIYGNDYNTPDGTCVRDYIHVVDLAAAHLHALDNRLKTNGCRTWNIGTGQGHSVLEIKETFERVNRLDIPFEYAPRRVGDLPAYFADNQRAMRELKWQPQFQLEDMLKDSWNWQRQNPMGFK